MPSFFYPKKRKKESPIRLKLWFTNRPLLSSIVALFMRPPLLFLSLTTWPNPFSLLQSGSPKTTKSTVLPGCWKFVSPLLPKNMRIHKKKKTKLWVHFQTLEQDSRNVGFKPHNKKKLKKKKFKTQMPLQCYRFFLVPDSLPL